MEKCTDRKSVWSVSDREWFAYLSVTLFVIGLVLRSIEKDAFQTAFNIMEDVGTIGIFAVTGAFFIEEAIDVMGALTQYVKKKQEAKIIRRHMEKIEKRIEDASKTGKLGDEAKQQFTTILRDIE